MFWRGAFGFLIFFVAYFVAALLADALFELAGYISRGWPMSWLPIAGRAVGGFIGVAIGTGVLGLTLKVYPARAIGAVFIFLSLSWIVLDFSIVPMAAWTNMFWAEIVQCVVAAGTATYSLWLGYDLT